MRIRWPEKRLLKHMAWGALAGALISIASCALMFSFFPKMPLFVGFIVACVCLSTCMKFAKDVSLAMNRKMPSPKSIIKSRVLSKHMQSRQLTINIMAKTPVAIIITPATPISEEGMAEQPVPRGTNKPSL